MSRHDREPDLHPVTGLPRTRTGVNTGTFTRDGSARTQLLETVETNELLAALLVAQREAVEEQRLTNRWLANLAAGPAPTGDR